MENATRQFILDILDHGKDLTLATVRPDGYPQATTVSYANDGMTIYVGIGRNSQKAKNISRNNKVSLTINKDYQSWNDIQGLSIGGTAEILADPEQLRHAADCLIRRFPQLKDWTGSNQSDDILLVRIHPKVVSVLDYQKGFGHTELASIES
ncbi:pyridoxamine 5'-phosphate oxidase family protein [Noviherbaspirillum galbum]|uniref:Pyridoxamine 5'-phosphate oxidase family protein n=1 Tax=Noviherbaspirillum galbum TaxID=2709383 RepID=A0A6B3SQ74_9BURK|nr:pyridoxamine 5'-phosphate oxidase family protein [Noviherbaspirillum galbum]NEX62907.1 pyridoxamine 5'-phosphate oxidase family protein [Noviherbaspirillum galbum]